jgi:type IV secretion system protein VirD4
MAGRNAPSPFKFGYYYDEKNDKADTNEPQLYDGERHILLFGVNGAGKSTRILIENLVTIQNRSLVVFDMKGELAAQTMRARRQLGDVKLVNPYNVLDMGSDGYNPLALLDPEHDEFFDQAKELTVAMIESEGESNQFFSRTARGWLCGGIMWEVVQAKREGRLPSLLQAREWCLQPDKYGLGPDGKEILVEGVTINAQGWSRKAGGKSPISRCASPATRSPRAAHLRCA